MIIGSGYQDRFLSEGEVKQILGDALEYMDMEGQRVLVLTPDGTRTAPIPLFFRLFFDLLHDRVAALDYLIALGTHQPMSEEALHRHVGITAQERSTRYRSVRLFNHRWDHPDTFTHVGTIPESVIQDITNGRLIRDLPVRINRKLFEYDQILILGPVFPHEVVGFSGGDKYFIPGVAGLELIDFTHWLGALITTMNIIGTRDTPVRAVIERAVSMLKVPTTYFNLVVTHDGLAGLYIGSDRSAWEQAVDLSTHYHIHYVERPFQRVLSIMPEMYDDIWTAAKGMYKLEPVVADGGELIIYAPHIHELCYTHGKILDEVGYHVRDFFVKQWDHYRQYPWSVLAHSTHLRGAGTYENGIERPRITVRLATNIPRVRCEQVNLGYIHPDDINLDDWKDREQNGILLVPRAGETLYKLKPAEPKVHG